MDYVVIAVLDRHVADSGLIEDSARLRIAGLRIELVECTTIYRDLRRTVSIVRIQTVQCEVVGLRCAVCLLHFVITAVDRQLACMYVDRMDVADEVAALNRHLRAVAEVHGVGVVLLRLQRTGAGHRHFNAAALHADQRPGAGSGFPDVRAGVADRLAVQIQRQALRDLYLICQVDVLKDLHSLVFTCVNRRLQRGVIGGLFAIRDARYGICNDVLSVSSDRGSLTRDDILAIGFHPEGAAGNKAGNSIPILYCAREFAAANFNLRFFWVAGIEANSRSKCWFCSVRFSNTNRIRIYEICAAIC